MFHVFHIYSIISILFEEIENDLKKGKDVKIYNFGNLCLKKTKPRKHFNIVEKKITTSKGYKLLDFKLSKKIRNKICDQIDIDKTFKDDENE